MDQSVIAGVGNVYRAEALFRHGLDPAAARAGRCAGSSGTCCGPTWSPCCGTGVRRGKIETLRPEHDPRLLAPADRGAMCARRVYAYRRTGQPCLVCGTPIAHDKHLARNLFWCPTCQPAVSA